MTTATDTAFGRYLDARRARVEEALASVLPGPPAIPAVLDRALRYSLLAGGKRLRPVLTLLAAEAVSASPAAVALAQPAACAIELIHTYSLIHDDLPAMDNDTLRRGRPTSHVVFGEGLAILAGDGLLTEAFALLAREPSGDDAEVNRRKVQTIAVVASAAGAGGMVGGQALDLDASRQGRPLPDEAVRPLDAAALEDMHARKTGALIAAAAVAGAVMAGGSPAQLEAIRRYGTTLGLAFQIVDDILDVRGDAVTLGKTVGKDAAAGKVTYPAVYGLEAACRLANETRDHAIDALTTATFANADPLVSLARWVVERTR
jgi:geranylgeranyl diphosphate synthase type II